ncbi:uncharacterized protein [Leptinotarsa decemlineata]|uniref:uncharacterized protein n=1 Tax=Leptinotarsa decemlineata TaxID=7539 RepID=UPI003D3096AA
MSHTMEKEKSEMVEIQQLESDFETAFERVVVKGEPSERCNGVDAYSMDHIHPEDGEEYLKEVKKEKLDSEHIQIDVDISNFEGIRRNTVDEETCDSPSESNCKEQNYSKSTKAEGPSKCLVAKDALVGSLRGGKKRFQCKTCSKYFNRKDNLSVHEQIHSRKIVHCNICSKSFNHEKKLKTHEKSHLGETPFHCEICSKSFKYKCFLKVHEKLHLGNKPFSCKICSKSFTQLSSLKVHERIHTGEKPFNCKFCEKSFNQNSILRRHERVHTGEKPFQCEICSKSFNQAQNLKSHFLVHTGQKPFQCKVCLKSFNQRGILRRHESIHAEEKASL